MAKYLDQNGLLYFWQKIKAIFATADDLATTNANLSDLEDTVDGIITTGGEPNVIETIKVNNTALTPDANKAVNISVPTNNNQLTNGAGYQTAANVTSTIESYGYATTSAMNTALSGKQDTLTFDSTPSSSSSNPVTSAGIATALAGKVSAVEGKGLSENDFTNALLTKLNGIAEGATANTGTVTSVTIEATSPININSSAAITTSGSRTISHASSGVTAGTYKSVTVNATGHVTGGTNPTTVSGYGITDAYTKTETDEAIATAIGSITGVSFEIVQTLPATGAAGTIYLVSHGGTGTNIYDEYIYVSNAWEKIGTTDVDLTNYYNTSNLVAITNAEIDTILAA